MNNEFMFDCMWPCIGNYMGHLLAYVLEWGVPALARSQLSIFLAALDVLYIGII